MPEKAVIYEHGASAFVVGRHLKVMLEEDYLPSDQKTETPATNLIRQIILPAIEREVNEGQNFATLRQIYNSMILATWYKKKLKESLLAQVYVNQNKIRGIDTEDKNIKEKIYQQYLDAFKNGVYDYIKEEYDPATQSVIPKKYFSGGLVTAVKDLVVETNWAMLPKDEQQAIPAADHASIVGWRATDIGEGASEKDVQSIAKQTTEAADTAMLSADLTEVARYEFSLVEAKKLGITERLMDLVNSDSTSSFHFYLSDKGNPVIHINRSIIYISLPRFNSEIYDPDEQHTLIKLVKMFYKFFDIELYLPIILPRIYPLPLSGLSGILRSVLEDREDIDHASLVKKNGIDFDPAALVLDPSQRPNVDIVTARTQLDNASIAHFAPVIIQTPSQLPFDQAVFESFNHDAAMLTEEQVRAAGIPGLEFVPKLEQDTTLHGEWLVNLLAEDRRQIRIRYSGETLIETSAGSKQFEAPLKFDDSEGINRTLLWIDDIIQKLSKLEALEGQQKLMIAKFWASARRKLTLAKQYGFASLEQLPQRLMNQTITLGLPATIAGKNKPLDIPIESGVVVPLQLPGNYSRGTIINQEGRILFVTNQNPTDPASPLIYDWLSGEKIPQQLRQVIANFMLRACIVDPQLLEIWGKIMTAQGGIFSSQDYQFGESVLGPFTNAAQTYQTLGQLFIQTWDTFQSSEILNKLSIRVNGHGEGEGQLIGEIPINSFSTDAEVVQYFQTTIGSALQLFLRNPALSPQSSFQITIQFLPQPTLTLVVISPDAAMMGKKSDEKVDQGRRRLTTALILGGTAVAAGAGAIITNIVLNEGEVQTGKVPTINFNFQIPGEKSEKITIPTNHHNIPILADLFRRLLEKTKDKNTITQFFNFVSKKIFFPPRTSKPTDEERETRFTEADYFLEVINRDAIDQKLFVFRYSTQLILCEIMNDPNKDQEDQIIYDLKTDLNVLPNGPLGWTSYMGDYKVLFPQALEIHANKIKNRSNFSFDKKTVIERDNTIILAFYDEFGSGAEEQSDETAIHEKNHSDRIKEALSGRTFYSSMDIKATGNKLDQQFRRFKKIRKLTKDFDSLNEMLAELSVLSIRPNAWVWRAVGKWYSNLAVSNKLYFGVLLELLLDGDSQELLSDIKDKKTTPQQVLEKLAVIQLNHEVLLARLEKLLDDIKRDPVSKDLRANEMIARAKYAYDTLAPVFHQAFQDAAMNAATEIPALKVEQNPGGIDLNSELMDLQILRDEKGVPLPLPEQPIKQMKIDGFLPVIINITPATNLPVLLGLEEKKTDLPS